MWPEPQLSEKCANFAGKQPCCFFRRRSYTHHSRFCVVYLKTSHQPPRGNQEVLLHKLSSLGKRGKTWLSLSVFHSKKHSALFSKSVLFFSFVIQQLPQSSFKDGLHIHPNEMIESSDRAGQLWADNFPKIWGWSLGMARIGDGRILRGVQCHIVQSSQFLHGNRCIICNLKISCNTGKAPCSS